jgi:protoporphyrinogen oxidase
MTSPLRVGVAGGGIAGLTLARFLRQRLPSSDQLDLRVYDTGDAPTGG